MRRTSSTALRQANHFAGAQSGQQHKAKQPIDTEGCSVADTHAVAAASHPPCLTPHPVLPPANAAWQQACA